MAGQAFKRFRNRWQREIGATGYSATASMAGRVVATAQSEPAAVAVVVAEVAAAGIVAIAVAAVVEDGTAETQPLSEFDKGLRPMRVVGPSCFCCRRLSQMNSNSIFVVQGNPLQWVR